VPIPVEGSPPVTDEPKREPNPDKIPPPSRRPLQVRAIALGQLIPLIAVPSDPDGRS